VVIVAEFDPLKCTEVDGYHGGAAWQPVSGK
jgi:hypothetical protein